MIGIFNPKESIISLFNKIKSRVKDPIFRTTLIVGYPGETKEDLDELKEFIKEYHFNHLGVFTYSKEEGTYGAKLPNQIDEEEKVRRKEEIMELQSKISYQENKNLIGKTFKGMIIGKESENVYLVRCGFNAIDDIDGSVFLSSKIKHNEGDIVNIKITHAFVYDLFSEEVLP